MNLKTTSFPFKVNTLPFFYGWVILIAGTLGILMSIPGQTMGVSVFTDHLLEALSIERTSLSLAYMIGTISSGLLITKAGKYYDKYGARLLAMVASFMLGLVLIYLSKIDLVSAGLSHTFAFIKPEHIAIATLVLGFFGIRFFGQGILTMVSRNMVMKWFETRRGLANALMGVFVSFGFSYAPRLFKHMIDHSCWRNTWLQLGIIIAIGFSIFILLLFRDNAKDCGLQPDGKWKKAAITKPKGNHEFTLKEATRKYAFWVFNLTFALHALYITAITFHIVSIFKEAGYESSKAIAMFLPASFVAVAINFVGGWLSDYIKLKYLLIIHLLGVVISGFALTQLSHSHSAFYFLIVGYGVCSGIFSVINTVTWPRFFGTKHLGSISGFAMSWIVIASALGPHIFSLSLKHTGSYTISIYLCMGIAAVLLVLGTRANNVQE